MSLLIKGLDMPKLDENEERLWVPGWIEVGKDGKAIFCTGTHFDPNTIHSYAVEEVPAPHGRLIDANELKKNMRNYYPSIDHLCCSQHVVTKGDIDNAPTVIETEVSE